jgi:nicotinate-nucleotide adenylyltransferase
MKIGIFGGTFNPIHQGHLAIAEEVRSAVRLEKVLFIPAGDPPHKKGQEILPARHRLEMVRLAIKDDPHFEISETEIHRPGKSYTVETITTLKAAYPPDTEWFLILGLDAFLDFPTWREPDRLLTLCHFVVVSRPGFRFRELTRLFFFQSIDPAPLARLDEQKEDRHRLAFGPSTQIILLRVGSWEISATEIRSHLSGGKRRRNLLPPSVESYIMSHHLYTCSK